MRKVVVSTTVEYTLRERLRAKAKAQGVNLSTYLSTIIERHEKAQAKEEAAALNPPPTAQSSAVEPEGEP